MLASVYQSAGYRTGLFTSPHLIDYRERMTVNSEWIAEKELLRFFQAHGNLVDELNPTYFELATVIAFWHFREKKVDIAVIETGLGGRLDATNVITPIASVITSVGMDHTDILGDTLAEIALEKGGIIKQNRPVILGELKEEALNEVQKIAAERNARIISTSGEMFFNDSEKQPLAARLNGGIAEAVVDCLSDKLPVTEGQKADGFKKWMGRFPAGSSFRRIHSDYPWYFDGAHNVDALKLLKVQMKEIAPLTDWTMVFAMMRDKFTSEIVSELSVIGNVYYCPLKLDRAASEKEVKQLMPEINIIQASNSLPEPCVQKNKSELVIFGGSFYFYKTLMQWMDNIVDC
jgi:dihydrofolate synthase/folylpolyglutamate synthase